MQELTFEQVEEVSGGAFFVPAIIFVARVVASSAAYAVINHAHAPTLE